jgi:hypothetical protein
MIHSKTESLSVSTITMMMMIDDKEQETEKPLCNGGVHCLKLKDKKHSTQFIYLKPVNFSFFSLIHIFSFDLFSLLIIDKFTID